MMYIENNIEIDNIIYPYIIEKKKIKNIYFRVKEDLKIHISANPLISHNQIRKLLLENKDAIKKMYQKQATREDTSLRYLGNKLAFEYAKCDPYIENDVIYGPCEEICQSYIYSLSLNIFKMRLNNLVEQFDNLPSFTLKSRKMKSKWGVCNKRSMTITLNTELITKEVHLIDYVIVHELCHFKYMDHSKDYWNYVSSFYPYYKQARKELKY